MGRGATGEGKREARRGREERGEKWESDGKKRNGDEESESRQTQERVDYFFCYLMWISFVIA
jgi:hypothetical protein